MVLTSRNKFILFIVFLSFFNCDQRNNNRQNVVRRSYYKNGNVKSVSEMDGGLINGTHLFYYPSGTLQSRGTYLRGLAHGTVESFYENGKLKSRSTWLNGKEEGNAITYFKNGSHQFIAFYKMGKIVGRSLVYHEDGKVRERKLYDSLGNIQHIMVYALDGSLKKSFVVPYLKATKDSVRVDEEVIITIKFPLTLTGDISIEASEVDPSGNTFYEEEVLNVHDLSKPIRYRRKFDRFGKYKLTFKFKHFNLDQGDTLSVDNVVRDYSISVIGVSS